MDVTKPINRRTLLGAASATGAALAAGSLLPSTTRAARSADTVTLNFWLNHDPVNDVPLFKQLVARFEAAYPSIKINMANYPGNSFDTELIPTHAVSGTLPDVWYNRTFETASRATRGWTLNLNPYVRAHNVNVKDFWPAEVLQMTWKGQLQSLPYDWSDFGIYYNKTLFDKKGIKYPPADGNWTWDDVLKLAQEFVDTSGGRQTKWGLDISPVAWGWPTIGFVLAWGGKWLGSDLHTFLVDTPEAAKLFQTMQDAVYVSKVAPRSASLPAGFDPWSSGNLAMSCNGSWATLAFRQQIGSRFAWDVAPLPKGPTGKRPVSPAGGAWSIAATSKHPDEAFTFVNYITSTQSEQFLISQPTKSIPGRQSAVPMWVSVAKSGKLPPAHVQVFPDGMKDAYPVPTVPYYDELATITGNYVGAILSSKKTVKDALAAWQRDGQAAIKKYKF